MANNNIIQGSSFDLSYRRTTHEPIDCSSVFKTLEDARVYALNNCKEEAFVPYAGQIISVLENNAVYKLVKAENVVEIEERKGKPHYQLALVGSQNDNDDRYLRKDIAETVDKLMTFIEGINVKGTATLAEITLLKNIVSKNFAAGATGFGITRDEDGNYHLDIDFVDIRKKLNVNEIQVQRSTYIGGKQYNTHGGIICDRVEDHGDAYRCYFKTTDAEGRTVRNTFEAGDLAISETFALKTGTTFYWRYVSGCGDNYIDLSKTDCARGSDAPAAGDNIVQLGNRSVTSRQGAIVWDSVTPGGPYVRIYKDINSYTMPEPVIDLNTVLSEISAKLINRATGKDVDEILEDLQADMDKVREQTDKMFVIWFDEYVPTLSNLPASGWTDDATKASHEQDLFYNTSKNVASGGGRAYRFEKSSNGSYRWAEVTDKDTVAALEAAAKAQSTADGKRRVFVSRPKDSDVYDIGDLWVNAVYGDGSVSYDNDSLVCIAAKVEGASFSIAHWRPTSTATTAYLENLGDRIIAAVSDSEKGLAEAKKLARQGIDDAYNAAQSALESLGLAGSAAEMAKDAQDTSSRNTAAIQVTKDSIAALAQGIHFDKSGKITNINTSGLVTTEDFNVLLSKKVNMDSEGHITNISTSGLVTEAGFAQMFSERADADGYVKRAEISTFVTEDEAGRLISNATIQADRINFLGKTVINGKFVVDEEGNVTMNGLTANNGTFNGTINADSGRIGGFSISKNGLTNVNEDGTLTDDVRITFRSDRHKYFVGIGENVFPSSTGGSGVAWFENHDDSVPGEFGYNCAIAVSAQGANQNTAIRIAGGCISGLAYKTISVRSSITLTKDVVSVACLNTGDISITLPDMDVWDDGHVIKIKRLSGVDKDNAVKIYAGNGYHNLLDEISQKIVSAKKHTYIFADATTIYALDPRILPSVGDAIELVYHRDVHNGAYGGCWVEYKHPRDW